MPELDGWDIVELARSHDGSVIVIARQEIINTTE